MAEQDAGWRNDPYGRFEQRYFNGKKWTEHVATGGEQQVDPLGASMAIPIAIPPTAFTTSGRGQGIVSFLDRGPDSRERPLPSIRTAVAGLGGVVLAAGVFGVALGDDPSRGRAIAIALAVIAVAWLNRTFVKLPEVQAAAVGMVVVAIPTFAVAATASDGGGSFWTGLLLAALFVAAWLLPGFKNRNLLLGLGAIALVFAFGSLSSTENSEFEKCNRYIEEGDFDSFDEECQDVAYEEPSLIPTPFTDNVGDQGIIYLVGGAAYLGLTWWLDRRGQRGTATAFAAAGLLVTLVGTAMLAAEFGGTWAPVFVLAVGLIISLVGSHGGRRATTWWGAVLTTIAVVWFVTVQWDPKSTVSNGGAALVAGAVLIIMPFLTAPIRKLMQARRPGGTPPPPPAYKPSK